MARKHEHFGLSYLEELSILKERENICKESRQKFLKFKQETATADTDLKNLLWKITPPDQSTHLQSCSHQSSRSPPLLLENTCPSPDLDISNFLKKVRISSDILDRRNEAEDVTTQEKKYPKSEVSVDKKESYDSRKAIVEYKNDSLEDNSEKRPVVIASLVGTSKQLIMLKKPEPPPKHKYRKVVRTKSHFKSSIPLQTDSTGTEQPEQKILSEHAIPAIAEISSLPMEIADSYSMVSSSSEKPSKIHKEISKTSSSSSKFDLYRSCSKKSSCSSSVKSASESMEEALGGSRSDTSKDHVRHSSRSKLQMHVSVQKLSSGMVSRSIDEIIASLKSTAPTASDLRIKELLESILGQDYSIKIELPTIKKGSELESPIKEVTSVEMEQIKLPSPVRKEPRTIEFESPSEPPDEQVTSADAEQTKLESITPEVESPKVGEDTVKIEDIPESSRRGSIFFKVLEEVLRMEDDTAKIKDTPGRLQKGSIFFKMQEEAQEVAEDIIEVETETPKETPVHVLRISSQEIPNIQESEKISSSEAEQLTESANLATTVLEKVTFEVTEEFLSSDMDLSIKGKALPKAKPVEIEKSLEDLSEQQPVSLLSTWTTKIKDVDYPLIHLLCMASPRCVLPVDLQLVSRVHHTLDKKGHNVLLPSINLTHLKPEELFPATAALEEQMERERICNEGLPISEVYQCSQEDGIKVLPPQSPRSMPEWQSVAEFYVEKPQLELLGEKVKLHPASLKMFWTPAPQKFSAPLSLMKKTLFSKYESNMINGVIYEDFSCDLREEEESEPEDDFDNLLSNFTVNGRHSSCPQLLFSACRTSEEEVTTCVDLVKRSTSAPELSSYRDKGSLKISANFKTTMEEIDVMKKHEETADIKAILPVPKVSPVKIQQSSHSPSPLKSSPIPLKSSPNPLKSSLSPLKSSPSPLKSSPSPLKSSPSPLESSLSPLESSPSPLKSVPDTDKDSDSVKGQTGSLGPFNADPQVLDNTALAAQSRKAGIKYIIYPKKECRKKSLKSGKRVTPQLLKVINEKLNEPPRIIKRPVSLGKLHIYNKFDIKVSHAVRCYRSPSLPCMMDFEKFAEKQGRKPDNSDDYLWARTIWIKWFNELYPPRRQSAEEKERSVTSKREMEEKTIEKELADSVNPLLWEGKTDELEQYQSEIDRITQLIKEGCSSAFHYCRRGAIYRKIGKLKAAMNDLEKAISLEPMLVNAYWHRHLLFLYQSKTLPALEDLNFIIKCNKNNADAYLSRADIYKKQGNNSLAIINYTLATRCRPTDDEIYYKRGEAHEEDGDLLMAMEDYSKCLYYNPNRIDALMKHGRYYFNKSSWGTAINDFTTVIKEDPNNSEARTYRARAYIKQEQYKNAGEDLAAAIHLNPCNWIAYYCRGCILRKVEPKQALQDLSISVLLNHSFDNVGAFLHRGILYSELKQWALAICDFESALALDRNLITAYVNIGLILMLHQDNYFESIQQFTLAIQVDPLDIRSYLCRAQAYHRVHDLKRAVKDINRAIHLQPNSPQLCLTRGQYLLAMENYDLASFCIHQVAEMDEGSLKCSLVQKALVHSFCQNHKKAIECALEVTKKQPEPAMFVLLGKIQMKAKKHKDAVASFKQALTLLTGSAKTPPNTFEAAEIYLFMGQCYMEQMSLLEAYEAFTSAVRLSPRYADAYYQRGLCRMQLQQAKCIFDFNKTLAILPTHYQAYLSRAAYFGSKGRYSKAIMNCTEAIKIEPNSVRGYLYRGALKCYNRTYKHAVEDLTRAIDLDNACILAYYNRAISFHQLKDWKNALKDYGIVLLLEANTDTMLKVLINRALLYAELDQHDNALQDFAEVALSKPKDTRLYKVLGLCYHRLQKYEEAVHSFSKLLKLDPFSLDGYIGRGNSYMEFGHEEGNIQARKDFLKAIHLNPMCIKARLCLGYNLQALGKFQKAWAQFTAAILIDPKCHLAYDGRAIVCLQMGDYFAAFQDTNAALKITTNAELLTNRGVINQFMGFLNCAMKDYQQAITVDPSYALAYFNAANIYFLNKQFSQANKYYSKALMLDPRNESAFLNRAITNTLLKNFEEAKEDFEKAISLSPFSAAIYFNKANLYSTLQQYEQAEEDISKALSIQPYDALMYKLRADIRGKMGFVKEAITDYKKAISIQELISTG